MRTGNLLKRMITYCSALKKRDYKMGKCELTNWGKKILVLTGKIVSEMLISLEHNEMYFPLS